MIQPRERLRRIYELTAPEFAEEITTPTPHIDRGPWVGWAQLAVEALNKSTERPTVVPGVAPSRPYLRSPAMKTRQYMRPGTAAAIWPLGDVARFGGR